MEQKPDYLVNLILEVSSEQELEESRWICFDLPASVVRMEFCDRETGEGIEILYFIDGTFTHIPPWEYAKHCLQ